jgi:hypothetical protein
MDDKANSAKLPTTTIVMSNPASLAASSTRIFSLLTGIFSIP